MRNLNCRFLILEGEGRLEWAEAANPLRLDGSVDLHEQRVETRQQLRAKAQFLCLKVCQSVGGCPLRFLGFDAGELACSVLFSTCVADAAGSLDRSRMTTLCTR